MKKNLFLALFFVFFFYGCGGGGASSSGVDSSTSIKTAYFYDSAVNGIEYNCGNKITGLTGDSGGDGSFRYQSDCTVEFKIGKIHLGSVAGSSLSSASKVYPTTILGLSNSVIDERVENMLVFLQTLDNDNNLSNGITISPSVKETLTYSELINNSDFVSNFNSTLSDLNTTINNINSVNSTNYLLISKEEALLHFQETLKNTANITVNLSNPKPYLVDKYGRTTTLTSIKTANTLSKDIIIKGKANTKIFLAFNSTGSTTGLSFVDTNKTIGSDRNGYLTLDFNDDTITNFHYFIKLIDSDNVASEILHLDVEKDVIPPHVNSSNLVDIPLSEEEEFLKDINATDAGGIEQYRIIKYNEDNRSIHWEDFNLTDGAVRFIEKPSYEEFKNNPFQVVVRAIDYVGNMTDVLITVFLDNILDNPPALDMSIPRTADVNETIYSNNVIFPVKTLLKSVDDAPDNNESLAAIKYKIYDQKWNDINLTDWFDINETTGNITMTKNNITGKSNIDLEKLPYDSSNPLVGYVDVNVTIENNNTRVKNADNITYRDCVNAPDYGCNATLATIRIYIHNVIDEIPKLNISQSVAPIAERKLAYQNDYIIGAISIDTIHGERDDTMESFTILTDNSDGNFTIDENGTIYVKGGKHFDFETNLQHNLTIQATNKWYDGAEHPSNIVNLDINITNVVDIAPKIELNPPSTLFLLENTPSYSIATFKKVGTNIDQNFTTSFSIESVSKNNVIQTASSHPFNINTVTGEITTKRDFTGDNDYNETADDSSTTDYNITVLAHNIFEWNNSISDSDPVSVILKVLNVIDNPPVLKALSSPTISLPEMQPAGTYIAQVDKNGTIYDENQTTSFHISSGNELGYFRINSTGKIDINKTIDWENNETEYNLKIIAKNDAGESNQISLDINITNVIEKKPNTQVLPSEILEVHENIDIGEVIAFIDIKNRKFDLNGTEIYDINTTDERTISDINITSGDATKFDIREIKDANGSIIYGELYIKAKLDYETKEEHNLTITLYNGNNQNKTTEHNITIEVKDDVEKEVPIVVVLVNFSDVNVSETVANIKNNILIPLNTYMERVSHKKFNFTRAKEKFGDDGILGTEDDGVIIVTLKDKMHPQGDADVLASRVKAALQQARNDNNITFSDFDKNTTKNNISILKDGKLSKEELQILVIVAEDTNNTINDIHQGVYNLTTPWDINGTKITSYVVVGEKENNATITYGSIAKFISESLFKFPAEDTNYKYGNYDLMGIGYKGHLTSEAEGTKPVHVSIFNKANQGWKTPKLLRRGFNSNIDFFNTHDNIDYNAVKIMDRNISTTYYLIENRNKTLEQDESVLSTYNFDNGLEGIVPSFDGGLIIWKVEPTEINIVPITNTTNNIFRPTYYLSDYSNLLSTKETFEFTEAGTIYGDSDSIGSKKYSIKVKVK